MERSLGPDPARSGSEGESRSFRPIQGGDAAKAAEEAAAEAPTYQRTLGINLRTVRGAKFELEKNPRGPGEALPVGEAARQQSPVVSAQPAKVVSVEPANEGSVSGITRKLFHKLFRS